MTAPSSSPGTSTGCHRRRHGRGSRGVVVVGIATLAALRRWGRAALLPAAAVLVAATIAEAAGTWVNSTSGLGGRLGDLIVPAIAWSILAAALTQLRRARDDASLLVGGAAAGLAWLFGVSDWSWLFASQLPTSLAPAAARATIAVTLGVGAALAISAGLDARRLLTTEGRPDQQRSRAERRARPSASATPDRKLRAARRTLIVLLVLVGLAFVFATAPHR